VTGLLEELEGRVAPAGIGTLAMLVAERERLADYLGRRGYRGVEGRRYVERDLVPPLAPAATALLEVTWATFLCGL
jgi:hypothetical protein